MATVVDLGGDYAVGTGEITLRIVIGEGQQGSSLVQLDGSDLASGTVAMVRVGRGADVAGKELVIATTVTDVQRLTNRTSVQYSLSGGPQEKTISGAADATEEGGSVHYVTRVNLT